MLITAMKSHCYWLLALSIFHFAHSGTDFYGCVDLAVNCQLLQAQNLCTNQIYLSVMVANCKRTCNYCDPSYILQPPQPQQQQIPINPLNPSNSLNPSNGVTFPLNPPSVPFTNNPYNTYYPQQFPPNPQPIYQPPATNCVDKSSNCLNWSRNGFCSSSFYEPSVKADYCGATCGLCGGNAVGTFG